MPYRLVTQDTAPHGFPEEYPTLEDWKSEGREVGLYLNHEYGILVKQVNLLLKQGRDWVVLIDTAKAARRKADESPMRTSDKGSEPRQNRWGTLMELRGQPGCAGIYYSQSVRDAADASQEKSENFLAQAIDEQGTTWLDIIVRAVPSISSVGWVDDNIDPTNYSVIKVSYLSASNPPCPSPEEIKNRILNATNIHGTSVETGMRAFNLSLAVEVVTSLPTIGGIHRLEF